MAQRSPIPHWEPEANINAASSIVEVVQNLHIYLALCSLLPPKKLPALLGLYVHDFN